MFDKKMSRREFIVGAVSTGMTIAAAEAMWPKMLYAQPRTGGHLKLGIMGGTSVDTLDPGHWPETFMCIVGFAIHGGLTAMSADGKIVPEVAESWEPAANGQEWIFKLKRGITFSNGKPLTTDDVINSINHHREGDSMVRAVVAGITDVKADGPDTVIMTLDSPVMDFPAMLATHNFQMLPSKDGKSDWQSGIGLGPYILEDFQPGVTALLRRNPDSYRQGYLDSAELINIPDVAARQSALLSGGVDVINRLDLKTADMLNGRNGIVVDNIPSKLHYCTDLNSNMAPLDNNDVRQAVKYGIDREEILRVVFNGYGTVGNDQPITSVYPFHDPDLAPKPYDPDRAKFHLKQAGLDSLDLSITVSDAVFAGAVDMCVLQQQHAAKAGINITVNRIASDGYYAAVSASNPPASMTWWGGRATENTMLTIAYSSTSYSSPWRNAEFDSLLVVAKQEMDENKRRQYYYELQRMVSENAPVLIPIFANQVCAYNADKVHHGEHVSNEWDLDNGHIVERWWM